jgi:hypothetical protein
MRLSQTNDRNCRSNALGARLEREIVALRSASTRLEEAVADLMRPTPVSSGRKACLHAPPWTGRRPKN